MGDFKQGHSYGTFTTELPIPLSCGDAVLSYPYPMSEEDFDWLQKTIDRFKKRIMGTAPIEDAPKVPSDA